MKNQAMQRASSRQWFEFHTVPSSLSLSVSLQTNEKPTFRQRLIQKILDRTVGKMGKGKFKHKAFTELGSHINSSTSEHLCPQHCILIYHYNDYYNIITIIIAYLLL